MPKMKDFNEFYRFKIPQFHIRYQTKYILIRQNEISHIIADGNSCKMYLINGEKYKIQKSTSQLEALLDTKFFLRIHKSHIVNLTKIVKLHSSNISVVVLENGEELTISRSKKDILLNHFRNL